MEQRPVLGAKPYYAITADGRLLNTERGTEVKPFIKCIDFWPDGIPERKVQIYKDMIAEGQIRNHHVIVNRRTNATTVEFMPLLRMNGSGRKWQNDLHGGDMAIGSL